MRRGVLIGFAFLVSAVLLGWFLHPRGGARQLLEFSLNRAFQEFFAGSIRIEQAFTDSRLRFHVRDFRAQYPSLSGAVPLVIPSLDSEGPVTDYFSKKGLSVRFQAHLYEISEGRGFSGRVRTDGGRRGFFEIQTDIRGLDLQEIEWLNPENLTGSAGEMRGGFNFRKDSDGRILSALRLGIDEPGGKLQAQFFDLLKPYLPQAEVKEKVEAIAEGRELVHFREARLRMNLAESDRMKIFLHIAVPDYNLNLNLNIEVRLDEENAFQDLAELIGLIGKEVNA